MQLDPSIPVHVEARGGWPCGKGVAIGWIDYSAEHFCMWKVAFDADGQVWDIPQSHVRLQWNPSMGRVAKKETQGLSAADLVELESIHP
jgi:hypothetical protein